MIDAGFGSAYGPNPTDEEIKRAAKYRMAQAQLAMLRLCRLCVSIKMHTQGMSVDDATKFFQENCYYEEKPARAEAMRGTFDLGYLNYTLGKLQILKLRNDYEVAGRREFFPEEIPRRTAQARDAPDSPAPRDHAQRPGEVGRGAVAEEMEWWSDGVMILSRRLHHSTTHPLSSSGWVPCRGGDARQHGEMLPDRKKRVSFRKTSTIDCFSTYWPWKQHRLI